MPLSDSTLYAALQTFCPTAVPVVHSPSAEIRKRVLWPVICRAADAVSRVANMAGGLAVPQAALIAEIQAVANLMV